MPDGFSFIRKASVARAAPMCRLELAEKRQEVTPPVLTVSGPEPRVEAIDGAETDLIDVSAMRGETSVTTNAFVEDPRVQLISRPVVVVKLAVEKIGGER